MPAYCQDSSGQRGLLTQPPAALPARVVCMLTTASGCCMLGVAGAVRGGKLPSASCVTPEQGGAATNPAPSRSFPPPLLAPGAAGPRAAARLAHQPAPPGRCAQPGLDPSGLVPALPRPALCSLAGGSSGERSGRCGGGRRRRQGPPAAAPPAALVDCIDVLGGLACRATCLAEMYAHHRNAALCCLALERDMDAFRKLEKTWAVLKSMF